MSKLFGGFIIGTQLQTVLMHGLEPRPDCAIGVWGPAAHAVIMGLGVLILMLPKRT